jgi:hypothetical protein
VIQLLHTSFLVLDAKGGVNLSIYVLEQWTLNFMYLDLELCLVITLNSYVCKTMWAWDTWLCACGVLLCFYSLRMTYARLKICDVCFSLVCWKPGVSGFPGHSGFTPDSPDFQPQISFSSLIECIICHKHLTIICCTSQSLH